MIRCEACGLHQANPACRACLIRELAGGPLFFANLGLRQVAYMSPEYRVALRRLGDEEAVHAEVKKVAKTLHMGAIRA